MKHRLLALARIVEVRIRPQNLNAERLNRQRQPFRENTEAKSHPEGGFLLDIMVGGGGFEPTTNGLKVRCSTN